MPRVCRTRIEPKPAEFWLKHLDACAKSGLTKAEYARRNSILVKSLYNWGSRGKKSFEAMKSTSNSRGLPHIGEARVQSTPKKDVTTFVPITLCQDLPGKKEPSAMADSIPASPLGIGKLYYDSPPSISICIQSRFHIEIRNDFCAALLAKIVNTLEQIK